MRRAGVAAAAAALLAAGAGSAQASTVIGLSIEDQARLSRMVVVGEVAALRGQDHPVHGIETAVTFRVTDVLKGDVRAGRTVVFHTRGGEAAGVISEAVGEAVLRPGQKALVFIEEVDGRLYNLGLSMSVWDVQEDRSGARSFTRALTDGLMVVGEAVVERGPVTFEEMAARVGYARRNPRFDDETLRAARGQGGER
jgi:hypothetical protein